MRRVGRCGVGYRALVRPRCVWYHGRSTNFQPRSQYRGVAAGKTMERVSIWPRASYGPCRCFVRLVYVGTDIGEREREKKGKKKEKESAIGSVPLYRKRMEGKGGEAQRQTYDVVLRSVKIPAFQILERVPLAKHLFNLCSPSCPPLFARQSFAINPSQTKNSSPRLLFIPIIFPGFLPRGFRQFRRICRRHDFYKYDLFACRVNTACHGPWWHRISTNEVCEDLFSFSKRLSSLENLGFFLNNYANGE